jgi:hypothetical protein
VFVVAIAKGASSSLQLINPSLLFATFAMFREEYDPAKPNDYEAVRRAREQQRRQVAATASCSGANTGALPSRSCSICWDRA